MALRGGVAPVWGSRGMATDPQERLLTGGGYQIRDLFYSFALGVIVIFALYAASAQIIPIVLAVLIWFFINGIAHALRSIPLARHVVPNWLSIVLGSLIVAGMAFLAGQLVVDNVSELSRGVDNIGDRVARIVAQIESVLGFSFGVDVAQTINDLEIESLIDFSALASTIGNNLSSTVLMLLYVLFLLLDQPFYDAKIRALCPDPVKQARVRAVLARIGSNTRAYVWIMTLVSIGVGLLTYFLASYFGLAGAGFWGFLAFALNFIPTIGSFLGILVPSSYALLQFDELEKVLGFAVSLGVVQFVMGNLLLPRIAGNRLNLSQFVVILSLTIWGVLWGPAGLFLAVPIMMVLTIVLGQLDSTRPLAILLSQTGRVGFDSDAEDDPPAADRRDKS